jgi:TetR/AcrR family transcriptional regulator
LSTEDLIKQTAKKLYLVEGKIKATTQDIADAAGVNRTLVHYYFKSKDLLLQTVFLESRQEMINKLDAVLGSHLDFHQKIENFIDTFLCYLKTMPYMQVFLITEINKKDADQIMMGATKMSDHTNQFLIEVQAQMDKGIIKPMAPFNFLINLFALVSYPMIMKPMYIQAFDISATTFEQLVVERKKMVLDLIYC